ncbi:MAG: uncharacterized protein JWR81_2068 [Pseudonocardia sp.]|jgi:WhiB family redox-sensing transcriptional regulator|nr:uncharacterized protein [Pseudonocardia sp.]MDT7612613.1 WhiB family transcriptional regulator, redox-sensing transcriptional regulator [Pseudonocardiales bacterium]
MAHTPRGPRRASPAAVATGWMARAACRDVDPEIFFPVGSGRLAQDEALVAKAVCHGCAVRSECLDWAMRRGHEFGVWGGLDADERQDLHLRRTRSVG